jgi:hypothetical protein
MTKLTLAAGAAVAALLAASAAVAATIAVTPGHLAGWQAVHTTCGGSGGATGSQGFAAGPGNPPLGSGSYRLTVGSNSEAYESLRSHVLDGRRLSDITALRYSSYESHFGSDARAVSVSLAVDRNGDGSREDTLRFQPADQGGATAGQTAKPNTWQAWDALRGGWRVQDAGTSGPFLVTLAHYASLYPNARVARTSNGSLAMGAGCGQSAWAGFVGYFDAVTVGAAGGTTGGSSNTTAGRPSNSTAGGSNGSGGSPSGSLSMTFNFDPAARTAGGSSNQQAGQKDEKAGAAADHKVAMCHNGHTIRIDKHAVQAHKKLGDTMGACGTQDNGDNGDQDDDSGNG